MFLSLLVITFLVSLLVCFIVAKLFANGSCHRQGVRPVFEIMITGTCKTRLVGSTPVEHCGLFGFPLS